jgi:hypothetical protein
MRPGVPAGLDAMIARAMVAHLATVVTYTPAPVDDPVGFQNGAHAADRR